MKTGKTNEQKTKLKENKNRCINSALRVAFLGTRDGTRKETVPKE